MKRIGCFLLCIFLYLPIQVYANEVPEVVSEFVYVYNLDEKQVIYEKKAQETLYPASMTKIMTTLVVLEQVFDLQTMITIPAQALAGLQEQSASVAGFMVGESVSVEDLLYGVMLPSGADATRALALHISGSEEAFVALMNAKAKELQLTNTHFVNTSGLHDDNHYSTAQDMAIIVQEAWKNETFQTLFSADQYTTKPTIPHPMGIPLRATRYHAISSADWDMTNIDIAMMRGGKTGFTLEGGLCLASVLEVNGASYIVISANGGQDPKSAQHLKDTFALGDYLKATYSKDTLLNAGESVGTAKVTLGEQNGVEAIVKDDVSVFKQKQDASRYEIELKDVVAPVEEGQEIGSIHLLVEGVVKKTIPLYAKQSVQKDLTSIFAIGGTVFVIVGILVSIVLYRRRRKNKLLE